MSNGISKAEGERAVDTLESKRAADARRQDKIAIGTGYLLGKIASRVLVGVAPAGLAPDTVSLALGAYGIYKGVKNGGKRSSMFFGGGLALLSPQIDALADRVAGAVGGLGGGATGG
jgi:hypothetical protein